MTDPFTAGAIIAAIGGIYGMFLRIERRLTRLETNVTHIKEHMSSCQPTTEEPTT